MMYYNVFDHKYKKQNKIMQKFIVNVTEQNFDLLKDEALECFVLSKNLPSSFIVTFADKAKELDKLILTDDPEICRLNHLDGLIADFSCSQNIATDFDNLKQNLQNKYLGIITRNRRHEAMLVSECEPDFVIFQGFRDGAEKVKELCRWYYEMFLLQSALLIREDGVRFTEFETDFVILDDTKYKIFVAKA